MTPTTLRRLRRDPAGGILPWRLARALRAASWRILARLLARLGFLPEAPEAPEAPPPLRVLHRSPHFLVVEKPADLVLNSDDPDRDSLHARMARQFPQLADFEKYKVIRGPCSGRKKKKRRDKTQGLPDSIGSVSVLLRLLFFFFFWSSTASWSRTAWTTPPPACWWRR